MEDDEKLILEAKKAFEECRKDLGFTKTFEQVDEVFFVKDGILKSGYVSDRFSRQLCGHIVETLGSWSNYLHGAVMPNPGFMANMTESKFYSEDDKKEMLVLISLIMELASTNSYVGVSGDKKAEAEFIDGAVDFWHDKFKGKMTKFLDNVRKGWSEQVKKGNEKKGSVEKTGFG